MKHLFLLSSFIFLFVGCDHRSSQEKLATLNGYWEIQKAELPEGITKEFTYNPLVDYFEVRPSKGAGFRKKLRPKLSGQFKASENEEIFTVRIENDSINLYYTTQYDSWKETILQIEENEMKVLNPKGIIYTYNRFTPYSADDGKKN